MAKEDLTLVRVLRLGDHGKDVVALKRMLARARVGFPTPVKEEGGKINDRFGAKLEEAIKRFQRIRGLDDDGEVGYLTFRGLVKHADSHDSHLLRTFARERIGDWGIYGLKSAFNGIDMGVDFKGKGPIPMFADGKIVRLVRKKSGWPGIGGLVVVQCDKGPMARFPIYTAEDIKIPASHKVGTELKKGELLAEATGTNQAPGIELGWAGPAPAFFGTRFHEVHGPYRACPGPRPRDPASGRRSPPGWQRTRDDRRLLVGLCSLSRSQPPAPMEFRPTGEQCEHRLMSWGARGSRHVGFLGARDATESPPGLCRSHIEGAGAAEEPRASCLTEGV